MRAGSRRAAGGQAGRRAMRAMRAMRMVVVVVVIAVVVVVGAGRGEVAVSDARLATGSRGSQFQRVGVGSCRL